MSKQKPSKVKPNVEPKKLQLLLSEHRFKAIIELLRSPTEKLNQTEAHALGLAYWHQGHFLQSLIYWYPLYAKISKEFDSKIADLYVQVLLLVRQSKIVLESMSEQELLVFFLAARQFSPEAPSTGAARTLLFESLWSGKTDGDCLQLLGRLLQSPKESVFDFQQFASMAKFTLRLSKANNAANFFNELSHFISAAATYGLRCGLDLAEYIQEIQVAIGDLYGISVERFKLSAMIETELLAISMITRHMIENKIDIQSEDCYVLSPYFYVKHPNSPVSQIFARALSQVDSLLQEHYSIYSVELSLASAGLLDAPQLNSLLKNLSQKSDDTVHGDFSLHIFSGRVNLITALKNLDQTIQMGDCIEQIKAPYP